MQNDSMTEVRHKPYKVIMVGMQAVGKSSLLYRIIESKFELDYHTTIGIDFRLVKVNTSNKEITLQIWDTAGQQKYSALTNSYFQGSHACIIVYDLKDRRSLERAQQYIDTAFHYNINPECIYLVGNKADETRQLEQEGRNIANDLNINYSSASAKTGDSVTDIVNNLAVKLNNTLGELPYGKQKPKIQIKEAKESGKCAC